MQRRSNGRGAMDTRAGVTVKRMRFVAILIAAFTLTATVAQAAPLYDVSADAAIRSTVLFVGDSNITRGATEITTVLTVRLDGAHLPVFGSRSGTGIRGYGSNNCDGCAASDYWAARIPHMLAAVTPRVVVIDLGINDALRLGTPTTVGYADYATKIDWLFAQLPPDLPVLWTNLPCSLEPTAYVAGCNAINIQLAAARTRHSNLTVIAWNGATVGHREYMGGAGIAPHYTSAGYTAWATLVSRTLDSRFPQQPSE
jgi:lysophospholipase L1-like esterase